MWPPVPGFFHSPRIGEGATWSPSLLSEAELGAHPAPGWPVHPRWALGWFPLPTVDGARLCTCVSESLLSCSGVYTPEWNCWMMR